MAAAIHTDLGPAMHLHKVFVSQVAEAFNFGISVAHASWESFISLHTENLQAVANGTLVMAPGIAVYELSRAQLIARMQARYILAYIAVHMTTREQFDDLWGKTSKLTDIIKLFHELRRIAKQLDRTASLARYQVALILDTIALAGGIGNADAYVADAAPVPNDLLQVASLCALHSSMFEMVFSGDTTWGNIESFYTRLRELCTHIVGRAADDLPNDIGRVYISALDGDTFARAILLRPWMKADLQDFLWLNSQLATDDASMQLPLNLKAMREFAALLVGTLVLHELTTAKDGSDVRKSMDAFLKGEATFATFQALRNKVFESTL
jgi:hypothetical protein